MLTAKAAEPIVKDLNLIASNTKEAVTITGNLDDPTVCMLRLTTYTTSAISKVTGTVTCDGCGGPLAGVSVTVVGTMVGVTTDTNGKYEINCPEDSWLEFSFLGHETLIIKRNGRTNIDVKMWES
jgi:hypothetical protein